MTLSENPFSLRRARKSGYHMFQSSSNKWFSADNLWEVIGNKASDIFSKSQTSVGGYNEALKLYVACLAFVACGLPQD